MVIPSVMATPSGNPFVAPGGPGATQEIASTARGAPPPPSITVSTTVFQAAAAAQGNIPGLSEFMDGLEAPEETLCATLCHVAEADLAHALESVIVNGRVLGPIPRAKLVGFIRSIFFAFNFTVPGLWAPVPQAPPSEQAAPQFPAAAPQEQPTQIAEEVLVPLCEFVDQASRGLAKPLTFTELALARRCYIDAAGCDPCEEHTPTGEQLAGLRMVLKANRAPYVDFAVWGPFGSRLSRFRKTDASVFVGNTLVTERVNGPVGFEAWAASWDLFAMAMVSLGAARIGTLAKYRAGIVQLTRLFPRMWSVLHTSETIVRTERWSRLREQIEGLAAMGGPPWRGTMRNVPGTQ